MKTTGIILKILAAVAAVGAAACLVIAYWDKILDLFYTISDKIEEKRAAFCCCDCDCDEFAAEDEVAF